MFHIALFEPEIPPNTGNIIRLCANTGAELHLIKPYGFALDHSKLKRAGLDYHELTTIHEHDNFQEFLKNAKPPRLFACSTKGTTCYADITFQPQDFFIFGPETRGLSQDLLDTFPRQQVLRIPMLANNRSLNLSNAVAVVLYEAWRQQKFSNANSCVTN